MSNKKEKKGFKSLNEPKPEAAAPVRSTDEIVAEYRAVCSDIGNLMVDFDIQKGLMFQHINKLNVEMQAARAKELEDEQKKIQLVESLKAAHEEMNPTAVEEAKSEKEEGAE